VRLFIKIREFLLFLSLTISLVVLGGCVAVPLWVFTESAFKPDAIQKLKQPKTDKNAVLKLLGDPVSTKDQGRYWYYFNRRETWGVIGGTSSVVFEDYEWLAVEFDLSGYVVFVEKNVESKCLTNGMCVNGSAPNKRDVEAKRYVPKNDECAVYLFLESLPWPFHAGVAKFSVGDKKLGSTSSKTYLFITHKAGSIDIGAYDLKMATHCVGGQRLYIKANKKLDWSWETGDDLAPINLEDGVVEINQRQLALPD
jgi:hypothetical protein